jgi:hypothetical protein
MPYGLPSAITLMREEIALAIDRFDEDEGRHPVITLAEGTVVLPQHRLADQDGWDGEWLCVDRAGKRLAILAEKLMLSAAL